MKKLIILLFSIFISINSYGGIFKESICFETDGQNIVFLPNETDPYTGKYLCKYDKGLKEREGRYKDGKLDGKKTNWNKNGQIASEKNYKDGKKDGKWTQWYENGQKEGERYLKDGKKDGKSTKWDENGQITVQENYKDGELID